MACMLLLKRHMRPRAARRGEKRATRAEVAVDVLPFIGLLIIGIMGASTSASRRRPKRRRSAARWRHRACDALRQVQLPYLARSADGHGAHQRHIILFITYAAYHLLVCDKFCRRRRAVSPLQSSGLNLNKLRVLPRAARAVHRARLPGGEPGHDRASPCRCSTRCCAIRHRPGLVRHHRRAVHRDGADHAADRHQPVRHPEHLRAASCPTW